MKSRKLVCHVVNSNIAIDSLPTLQILLGIVALFEKIYDVEPKSEKFIAARHYMPLFGHNN